MAFPPLSGLPALALQSDDRVHIPAADELQRSVLLVGAIEGASQADEATGIKRLPYEQGEHRQNPNRACGRRRNGRGL